MTVSIPKDSPNNPDPDHYKSDCLPETWDTMLMKHGIKGHISYCLQSGEKYVSRMGRKKSAEVWEELSKAIVYYERARDIMVAREHYEDISMPDLCMILTQKRDTRNKNK